MCHRAALLISLSSDSFLLHVVMDSVIRRAITACTLANFSQSWSLIKVLQTFMKPYFTVCYILYMCYTQTRKSYYFDNLSNNHSSTLFELRAKFHIANCKLQSQPERVNAPSNGRRRRTRAPGLFSLLIEVALILVDAGPSCGSFCVGSTYPSNGRRI